MTGPDLTPCPACRWRQPYSPLVCGPCRHRVAVQLHEVALLYPVLPAALSTSPVQVIDLTLRPVGGASTNTVFDPMGDQAGELPIVAVLDAWVTDWAQRLDLLGQLPVPTVFQLTKWLHGHLPWACDHHEAIGDFAGEIRSLLASVRRALNRDLTPVRYRASCPYGCGETLRRDPGADWIECGSCGRLWNEDEYGLLARAALDPDELLSTAEAALLATSVRGQTVAPATIRTWIHRGKLTQVTSTDGRTWIRKGDVEEVAAVIRG